MFTGWRRASTTGFDFSAGKHEAADWTTDWKTENGRGPQCDGRRARGAYYWPRRSALLIRRRRRNLGRCSALFLEHTHTAEHASTTASLCFGKPRPQRILGLRGDSSCMTPDMGLPVGWSVCCPRDGFPFHELWPGPGPSYAHARHWRASPAVMPLAVVSVESLTPPPDTRLSLPWLAATPPFLEGRS